MGKEIGHQFVLVFFVAIERLLEANEVCRDQFGTLVYELKESVLGVGPRLALNDGACLVRNGLAVAAHALAIAFHDALLQVGHQFLKVLVVGNDRF